MMASTLHSNSSSVLPQEIAKNITNFKWQSVSKNKAKILGWSKMVLAETCQEQ